MNKKMLKGVAIIGIAGAIVKVLGAFFRIPLVDWIGAEGMSYYGYAYTIYGALLELATAGIPIAVSRLVSENIGYKRYRNAHRIFQLSLLIMFFTGFILFLLCFFFSDQIAGALGNRMAGMAVRAVSPAILFIPILSTFRGYFQGRQNMNPTAISDVIEQLVRIAVGLLLAFSLYRINVAKAAAGAAFGASAGSFAALIVVVLIYRLNRRPFRYKILVHDPLVESNRILIRKILTISVPIMLGALIMPFMNMADTAIIVKRLQATGFSDHESKYLYGLISGYCSTLISIPQIFLDAIVISIVPIISRVFVMERHAEVEINIRFSFRLTTLLAFPCAIGLFAFSRPILMLLFGSRPDEVDDAVPTMMILSIGVMGFAIGQTSTGVLQAIGKQNIPVITILISMLFKVLFAFILVGIPFLNIQGAAISSLLAYIISFMLNNHFIRKFTGVRLHYVETYLKPTLLSALMAAIAYLAYYGMNILLGNALATLLGIVVGIVVYGVLLILTKSVTYKELAVLPKGDKLNTLIGKFIRWGE